MCKLSVFCFAGVDANRLEMEEEGQEAWRNRKSIIKFDAPDDDEELEPREVMFKPKFHFFFV